MKRRYDLFVIIAREKGETESKYINSLTAGIIAADHRRDAVDAAVEAFDPERWEIVAVTNNGMGIGDDVIGPDLRWLNEVVTEEVTTVNRTIGVTASLKSQAVTR